MRKAYHIRHFILFRVHSLIAKSGTSIKVRLESHANKLNVHLQLLLHIKLLKVSPLILIAIYLHK